VIRGYQGDAVSSTGNGTLVADNSGMAGVPKKKSRDWIVDSKIKLDGPLDSTRDYILKKLKKAEK